MPPPRRRVFAQQRSPTSKWGKDGDCTCVSVDDCSCILDLLKASMPPGFNAYMGLYMDVKLVRPKNARMRECYI